MKNAILTVALTFGVCSHVLPQSETFQPSPCELIPLPGQEVSFLIDGVEKLRWHAAESVPRPFFFPFNGPSGVPLTRMGHPGAPNHDHHRSIWFAHHDVNGLDFWADGKGTTIRQKEWLTYEDGNEEAIMAVRLGWFNPDGGEVMEQVMVAALRPLDFGEHELEFQTTFRVPDGQKTVELGKTNFGFLAVRVAKTISHHFGGGNLTNSEGKVGEESIFGKPAKWMDYSGPVLVGKGSDRLPFSQGITFFDHPDNPRYPTPWHVRSDGWMGAAFCLNEGLTLTTESPLTLRYLLHAHAGACDAEQADIHADAFSRRKGFEVRKSERPHRHWEVVREVQ